MGIGSGKKSSLSKADDNNITVGDIVSDCDAKVRIDEGREALTGEVKVLTIGLVSFPFYTRCNIDDGDSG